MRRFTRLALGAGAALGLSAWVAPVAGAEGFPPGSHFGGGGDHAVFVQTDNVAGNQIVAYHRDHDGTLILSDTYATGGLGGVLNGSAVDHLGSQGSLASDPTHGLLYAVNAGSNTVSVFSVDGDQLSLRQVVGSAERSRSASLSTAISCTCSTPRDGGSVSGYWVADGRLAPDLGVNTVAWPHHPNRHDTVHPHSRTGGFLARRNAVDRDNQGQRRRATTSTSSASGSMVASRTPQW